MVHGSQEEERKMVCSVDTLPRFDKWKDGPKNNASCPVRRRKKEREQGIAEEV